MKSFSKRILSMALVAALSCTLVLPVSAAANFSDVPSTAWYYNSVTEVVERSLMSGMGNGTFAPESKMTVSQFITVSVTATYSDQVATAKRVSNEWWDPYYTVALENGLITANEYTRTADVMNAPITRKEMARIASRVTVAKGEATKSLASTSVIADYNSIGGAYKTYVVDCFAKGILTGTDDAGTFKPDGVLTRAEACTVALKLVDPSQRTPKGTSTDVVTNTGNEYLEGSTRSNLPQAGDVIIKSNGTKVTLEYGPGGVLGACQGVDIYSGLVINGKTVEIGKEYLDIGGTKLLKDSKTGEVHTENDWVKIKAELSPSGKYVGDYDGEVFNNWWQWDSAINLWIWIGPSPK